jgi:heme-degrading monooxygenase HmoA
MNYEVLPGKEGDFEKVFRSVLDIMAGLPGHTQSRLYRDAYQPQSYLIVSEWSSVAAFEAFTASEQFGKVTQWGREKILAGRPKHEVYGATLSTPAGGCPVSH